jgi:hypothetical protein
LVNAGVALVVIAVAGATFVFSYPGVHAIALLGGVSAQLARYYPGLFDAVLVIACICAVVLRDGRWWARLWAWLSIIIVLGAIGAADVLHAMGYALRHRPTEGIVAVAPVVAVLMAFSLLLTLLRQSRAHAPAAPAATPAGLPALPASVSVLPIALPAAPVEAFPTEPQDVKPIATVPVPTMAVPAEPPTEPVPAAAGYPASDVTLIPAAPPAAPVPPVPAVPAAPPVPAVPAVPAGRVDAGTMDGGAQEVPKEAAPEEGAAAAEGADATEETIATEGTASGTVPGDAAPREAHPATQPDEVASAAAPTHEAPTPPDELAPPTVEVPVATVSPAPPHGIRYAGSLIRNTPPSPDYWDAADSDTEQFAGLVYRAREDEGGDDALADGSGSAARPSQPELDDDAPPFATAPFASMPRLNRVRSMPAPPADEDEDE